MQSPILGRMTSVSSFWRYWNESGQSGFLLATVEPPGKDDREDGGKDEALGSRGDSEEECFFGGEPFNILPGGMLMIRIVTQQYPHRCCCEHIFARFSHCNTFSSCEIKTQGF